MKNRKRVLANGYSKKRREVLGFGQPRENWFKVGKDGSQIKNDGVYMCKCGRSIYDHPDMMVGCHYRSMPYHGDLCPFIAIGEMKK